MLMIYLKVFVALFAIVDPIGNIPVFLGVTKSLDRRQRHKAFTLSVLIAFGILFLFSLTGQFILSHLFQIEVADIQIAGGIILFLIAVRDLLTSHPDPDSELKKNVKAEQIACVPLACPLLAGPGAMVTCMTTWNSPEYGPLATLTGIVLVLGIFWMTMKMVDRINQAVGQLIILIFSKVTMVLVAAIGVKMTIQGILFYFPNS